MKYIYFALLVIPLIFACPNSCSGHGTCGANGACTCYPGYIAGDCSQSI